MSRKVAFPATESNQEASPVAGVAPEVGPLRALAVGAVGRPPAPQDDLPQGGPAPGAGLAALAVGDQEAGVAAAPPVDHPIITKPPSPAFDGSGEQPSDRLVKPGSPPFTHAPRSRVDARQP